MNKLFFLVLLSLNLLLVAGNEDQKFLFDPSFELEVENYFKDSGYKDKMIANDKLWLHSRSSEFPQTLQSDHLKNKMIENIHQYIVKKAHENGDPKFNAGKTGELNPIGFRWDSQMSLAKRLYTASECFKIDPYVFVPIIGRESKFKVKVRSNTGAEGLTQLTTASIIEVSEQLKLNAIPKKKSYNFDYGAKNANITFNSMLNCYYQKVKNKKWEHFNHPYFSKQHITNYHNNKVRHGGNSKYFREIANKFKAWAYKDPDRYIAYGALYLRVMFAIHRSVTNAIKHYNSSPKEVRAFSAEVDRGKKWLDQNFDSLLKVSSLNFEDGYRYKNSKNQTCKVSKEALQTGFVNYLDGLTLLELQEETNLDFHFDFDEDLLKIKFLHYIKTNSICGGRKYNI